MIERILQLVRRHHGLRSVSLRYFNAAGASADAAIGEDWTRIAEPHPAGDEGDARQAAAGAGVRQRLPDARRHVHPRLHPRRRPRRRARARRSTTSPAAGIDRAERRHRQSAAA